MLYLIGGASRSGKTTVAENILKQTGVPYLSLDWIVMGFTNGMPQCGIHDKLFPDEIAQRLHNFLNAMCESMLWTEVDQVIEGEAILPELARSLSDRHPDQVTACFLGYAEAELSAKIRDLKAFRSTTRDWLLQEPPEVVLRHVAYMAEFSRKLQTACTLHELAYFDTSADFLATLEEATRYLTTSQ